MELYAVIEAIFGIVAGFCIAVFTKKAEGVTYGKLDKAGRITNILLLLVYICLCPLCVFFGMLSRPAHDGFLGILGWIVSAIGAIVCVVFTVIGIIRAYKCEAKDLPIIGKYTIVNYD